MSNKQLIQQYANTGAVMTKHQVNQLPNNVAKSYFRRRISQMFASPYDEYDVSSYEVVAMPEDVRSEFFNKLDDHNTIDDVLLSKYGGTREDRFKASELFIRHKGPELTDMDISGLLEANRGSEEIALITIEAKGDKLEYADVVAIIRKIKYVRYFMDNPIFKKYMRRLMGDTDMLSSVFTNPRNPNEIGEIMIEMDKEDPELGLREYYIILRTVSNTSELFSKMDERLQKWFTDALKTNNVIDLIQYATVPQDAAKIVPKDKLQAAIDEMGDSPMFYKFKELLDGHIDGIDFSDPKPLF
jgi:hypothetical protein